MKRSVGITFLLIIIYMVSASTTVTAESHRDLFGDDDFHVPEMENMGYTLDWSLIYPEEPRGDGFLDSNNLKRGRKLAMLLTVAMKQGRCRCLILNLG